MVVSPTDRAEKAGPPRKRGRGADPEETKTRLVSAAFDSLRFDGFSATTARAIAKRADCNQAAIYYHFGSIEALLIEALRRSSEARLEQYRAEIDDTADLVSTVATIERLYEQDRASGHLAVLTELLGALTASPELRDGIVECNDPWISFVEATIEEAAKRIPVAAMLPSSEVADVLLSLIVGVELRSKADGRDDRASHMFGLAALAATMVQRAP